MMDLLIPLHSETDEAGFQPYVLDTEGLEITPGEDVRALVFIVLKIAKGLMLAVPLGTFPDDVLSLGSSAGLDNILGPSLAVEVAACQFQVDALNSDPIPIQDHRLSVVLYNRFLSLRGGPFDPIGVSRRVGWFSSFRSRRALLYPHANGLNCRSIGMDFGSRRRSENPVLFSRRRGSNQPTSSAQSKGKKHSAWYYWFRTRCPKGHKEKSHNELASRVSTQQLCPASPSRSRNWPLVRQQSQQQWPDQLLDSYLAALLQLDCDQHLLSVRSSKQHPHRR